LCTSQIRAPRQLPSDLDELIHEPGIPDYKATRHGEGE
jgi:hypothetical protein